MPGAIQELVIGPFSGGINQFSDKSAIADNELEDCVNFDIDLDGSLKSRPPWTLLYGNNSNPLGASSQNQLILGTYVYNGVRFIVFHTNGDTGTKTSVQIYWVDGINAGTTSDISTTNGTYSTSIRYGDIVYIIPSPGSTGPGYSYNLSTGVVAAVAAMPKGNAAVVYKDSLFIGGGDTGTNKSRLWFSALADFTNWPGTNFFDINPGDGDTLEDFLIYQDNILLTKDNATYVLAYDTTPAQAVLKNINTDIGTKGPRCLVPYENSIFFLQYSTVYEMINYDFARVSTKIPFEFDATIPHAGSTEFSKWQYPVFLSRVGDRLVARFYNNLYVYHLRIKSWTRWISNDPNIQGIGPIFELDRTNANTVQGWETYVACSAIDNVQDSSGVFVSSVFSKIFQMKDTFDSNSVENGDITPAATPLTIDCFITTKQYDIGISHRFKRLMHWGVDMVTAADVTGILFPMAVNYRIKWSELLTYTWADLHTWGYPLLTVPAVTQISPVANKADRRFIRFSKSLRFRLLQFKVKLSVSGNLTDGPARLYTITAFIGAKELVPAAVN